MFSVIVGHFEGFFIFSNNFPGQTVNFCLLHVLHQVLQVQLRYFGTFSVHPVRYQIFAYAVMLS